jgi:hypothetical protein
MKTLRNYTVIISLAMLSIYFTGKKGYKPYYSSKKKIEIVIEKQAPLWE